MNSKPRRGSVLRRILRSIDYAVRKYLVCESFLYQGKTYEYFCHMHASTWRSERAIEIPIIWRKVQESNGKETLEVGNVLSNYFSVSHDVVDKYEKAYGVINEDAETFYRRKLYDLIISISTIEHIGWNEEPQDHGKILRCVNNLVGLLAKGGVILFTVPVGYNPHLDKLLFGNGIENAQFSAFRRVSMYAWKPAEMSDLIGIRYDTPWQNANGLVIVLIRK